MNKKITHPKVSLLWNTSDPRRVVAIAGRMTYSRMPVEELCKEITEAEIVETVNAILERRHWSCLRHVSFSFVISGISRACSHQLVRHTAGFAYEQRSQHYRTEKSPSFIETLPLEKMAATYEGAVKSAEITYTQLVVGGVPKEDARMVLPNAIETQLIMTCNGEALLNFVKTRSCRVNNSEIKSVAIRMAAIAQTVFPELRPYLGPTCWTQGMCFEGPKFDKVCKKMPWRTPVVIWTPQFPRVIYRYGEGKIVQLDVQSKEEETTNDHEESKSPNG
jgi:thymidylate synthase (FAD)